MAANRRPPDSPMVATVFAAYDGGGPVPPEQAWARADLAPRIMEIASDWRKAFGFELRFAAVGRSAERSAELHPQTRGLDGHVIGAAIDVAYLYLRAEFKKRGKVYDDKGIAALLDPICARHGFYPLGATRWPDPAKGQRGDWQHYQSDDYGGKRQVDPLGRPIPQAFATIQEAQNAIWMPTPSDVARLFAHATKGLGKA